MHCAARLQGRAAALLFQRFRTALIQRHIRLGRQHHVGAFEHRAFILVAEQMHFGVYARGGRAPDAPNRRSASRDPPPLAACR